MSFAGLWDRWHRGDEVIESCTIIVGPANNAMNPIHDRMPVIIEPKDEAFWLDMNIDAVPTLEALSAASRIRDYRSPGAQRQAPARR